jgi:gluconolactonase
MKQLNYSFFILTILFSACSHAGSKQLPAPESKDSIAKELNGERPLGTVFPHISTGSIDRYSEKLESIIPGDSKLEILAEGFIWSEGPVWLPKQKKLLFSDIPRNTIFQWSAERGLSVYLDSAGYIGPATGFNDLVGSNGLLLDHNGNLVICQHGNRQIARMNAPLDKPEPKYVTLTDNYKGKKLNSPNDAVYNRKGDLYFTDPPYGLPGQGEGPLKELDFQGIYKLSASGELILLDNKLKRPNGIGLSPDEKTLYVSDSDPEFPVWMAYTLDDKGMPVSERILYNASEYVKKRPDMGLPDGLKVDHNGNVFGTGPGGIYIISGNGELLGIINTGYPNGNCAFNSDESKLYITADMYLMSINLK